MSGVACRFGRRELTNVVVFDGGRMSRGFFWVLAGVAALVMGGCSAVPGTGPSAGAVIHNASVTSAANSTNSQADPLSYALVDINRDTVRRLSIPETFRGVFRSSQRAPAIYIGRGDRVDVTIFEAQAGGLFIPADSTLSQGNFVRLPTQEVGSDGSITVPYVGSVRATGRRRSGTLRRHDDDGELPKTGQKSCRRGGSMGPAALLAGDGLSVFRARLDT